MPKMYAVTKHNEIKALFFNKEDAERYPYQMVDQYLCVEPVEIDGTLVFLGDDDDSDV